jgi:hypothetical protein
MKRFLARSDPLIGFSCRRLWQDAPKEFASKAELIFMERFCRGSTTTDVSKLAVVKMDEVLSVSVHGFRRNIVQPKSREGQGRAGAICDGLVFQRRRWHIDREHADRRRREHQRNCCQDRPRRTKNTGRRIGTGYPAHRSRGRVIIQRAPDQNKLSEHSPNWHEAEIEIGQVLKGDFRGRTIKILFPRSDDVIWYGSPKPQKGTEGIWLLKQFTYAGKKLELLTAIDKADFLPRSEEERIMRLLKR